VSILLPLYLVIKAAISSFNYTSVALFSLLAETSGTI